MTKTAIRTRPKSIAGAVGRCQTDSSRIFSRTMGLFTAAAILGLGVTAAKAQSRYTSLTAFGDSYADSGINAFFKLLANPSGYPSSGASPSAVASAYPYVAYPYWLQSQLGLANSQMTNYAIGGSTTQVLNPFGFPFSLPFQLSTWNGKPFGPNDLVTISIGGNDGLFASAAITPILGFGPTGQQFTSSAATALGNQTAANATAAVQQLVAGGARNIVFAGFSDLTALPTSAVAPLPSNLKLYSQVYFEGLQTNLAPLAQTGVRIFLFDGSRLARQIETNLGAYGFSSYQYVNPTTQSLYQPEGVHLTSLGFDVMARYLTNLISAPDTVAAQADVSQLVSASFAGSLFQRLDAFRTSTALTNGPSNSFAYAPAAGRGPVLKTPGVGSQGITEQPLSVYMEGAHYSGSRGDRVGANGFDCEIEGGTIGAGYKLSPNILVGGAFNYSNPKVGLSHAAGHIAMDAYQFGGFASFNYTNWFADVVTTYGHNQYRLDRTGVLSPIQGSTAGETFSLGARGGYLFDVAQFRVGPIAGLNYGTSHINAYTETGDPLLTFTVSQPNLASLTGSAGVQVRLPLVFAAGLITPYVNLTAEHDFLSGDRTLLSIET
ncbi:uncharacterized protein YhjY with autotransporter beta-barrel domain/phospholipase/lecithinase/hemolysin [Bradyrhizobium sp. CIR48]|uniref:autotransporter domain-containing protein n=1 Tax=Bradyrhizobium sp. CIR48 TaxID=2663840 RepID=UPI0016064201|nr:autotransporter domain-containing protein [Bradyrhizobium sp. CIR48]MBB4425419.1 uncharacterized protein YhjY with autotransporter beta-barrel domain/phospholipase/lecithinase/hemolysin [Bradyrhizobium sp. CIR48]